MNKNSRAPKLLGDFGEGLVTYALIRKGYEVANVDHVGADLIAEKKGVKLAVSVKTRMFKRESNESLITCLEDSHLEKLEYFAKKFDLKPVIAQVACVCVDSMIHLFIISADNLKRELFRVKDGYNLRFSKKSLPNLVGLDYVDYSCWGQELIGKDIFTEDIQD